MMGYAIQLSILLALFVSLAPAPTSNPSTPTTRSDLARFLSAAETRLNDLAIKSNRAAWVHETYITDDTEQIAAAANEQALAALSELAAEAKKFEGLEMSPEEQRKLMLLKLSVSAPAPSDPRERAELAQLGTWLDGTYGKAKYCPKTGRFAGKCLGQSEMERAMATTKDPAVLLDLWVGWRTLAPPMRHNYTRFVELANKGARELGFADLGALWRSNYDMPPDEFSIELERLWNQVRPLYLSLHAYVRSQMFNKYGPQVISQDGPIPAHRLGNIWAQEWTDIYDLFDGPGKTSGIDLTPILERKRSMTSGWFVMEKLSLPPWDLTRCPRASGSDRCSGSLRTAT